MFFKTEERRLAMQEMIVADDEPKRGAALAKLLSLQRDDFVGIFEAMAGRPVTIRLIDPPLHKFLRKTLDQTRRLAEVTGLSTEFFVHRSEQLYESHRGYGFTLNVAGSLASLCRRSSSSLRLRQRCRCRWSRSMAVAVAAASWRSLSISAGSRVVFRSSFKNERARRRSP